mgnify:CR=1 FL=1
MDKIKRIGVLGSTGSIGTQTLEIVRNNKDLQVTALAAGTSVTLMEQQIREFLPQLAVMWTEEAARDLKERVADLPVKVLCGMDGLLTLAAMEDMDILVTAIVGMIVARQFCRKRNITQTTRIMASIRVFTTSCRAARTKGVVSKGTTTSTP